MSEFLDDEEQSSGEGGEQEPQEDVAGLNLAAPLLVVGGTESDVAIILAVLERDCVSV